MGGRAAQRSVGDTQDRRRGTADDRIYNSQDRVRVCKGLVLILIGRADIDDFSVYECVLARVSNLVILPEVGVPNLATVIKRALKGTSLDLKIEELSLNEVVMEPGHLKTRWGCPRLSISLICTEALFPQIGSKLELYVLIIAPESSLYAFIRVGVSDATNAMLDYVSARDGVDGVVGAVVVVPVTVGAIGEDEVYAASRETEDTEARANVGGIA